MTPLEQLKRGEVVLLDTDTLPGLHALATRAHAAESLRRCKGSPEGRPFLLLFADLDAVLCFGRPKRESQVELLRRAWPGPLTALLCPQPSTPPEWVHEGRSIAARVPAYEPLRALLEELGAPLFSTSANRAGEAPAQSMAEAMERFPQIAGLTDAEASGLPPMASLASTLVDLTFDPGVVVRAGAAPWPPQGSA